ncbi:MAG: ribosome small subunit-dependent GTPase A [Calditrichaeota bacterium]|nr:ribosome small subunit-dependent GTPase A [Calditrichota bacterium]
MNDGGIERLIILNKIDLIDANELEELEKQIHQRHPKLKLLSISGLQETAVPRILAQMEKDKIYCFIGSSGVGKSTIINQLLNDVHFKTQSISDSNAKGKHTTTHRELIELENGSIVIDTPGMKEIGISANESALSDTFSDITNLAASCRFTNCSHKHEPGCAIREAIQSGDLDEDKFSNYQKLQRETERFQLDKREKHLKDKQQGKLYKSIQNANRKLKY